MAEAPQGRDVIVTDYSCTKAICTDLVAKLWQDEATRPLVLSIPATGFSDAHTKWVVDYKNSHGGEFLQPFIRERAKGIDIGRIGCIGFSAGCWGIAEILRIEADAVDFAYGCDGIHAGYTSGPGSALKFPAPWLDYAKRAAASEKLMVDSFSKITPGTYAGTRETANGIASTLGFEIPATEWTPESCDAFTAQESGGMGTLFMVGAWPAGTAGNDAAAHIYQANVVQAAVWCGLIYPYWTSTYGGPASFPGGTESFMKSVGLVSPGGGLSNAGKAAVFTAGAAIAWATAKVIGV